MEAANVIDTTTIAEIDHVFDSAAGHLNAQHGRLVAAVAWMLDNVSAWQGDGLWTPEAYVRWRTGTAPATAAKLVAVARRAGEFPACVAALQAGELSLDQLAPITRHAPGWCDTQMAGLAPRCTVAQITKIARQYPWDLHTAIEAAPDDDRPEPEPMAPPLRPAADEAWFGWDDQGRFRIGANVGTDTGLLLEAALTEARNSLFTSNTTTSNPNTTSDVDTVDVLVELANRSLGTVTSPARANRYRINVFIDRRDVAANGDVTDQHGRLVPAEPAARIMCDPLISPILFDNGLPVSVGRTQHIVPDRTRRLVEHRDGGCRVPGCTRDRYVEVHHIIHWADGGPTDTANLICLCPHHHRLHHQHRLGITGNADLPEGVRFTDANGNPLTQSGARPEPPGAPPPPTTGTWQHPLGERLDTRWLHFHQPRSA